MIEKINYKSVALHVLAWVGIIIVNLFIVGTFMKESDDNAYSTFIISNAPLWLVYLLFFYFNLYVLVPKMMMKGRYFLYTFIALVCVSTMSFATTSYNLYQYRDRLEKEIVKEKERTDIDKRIINRNIHRLEYRLKSSRSSMVYNPFHHFNISATYGILLLLAVGITIAFVERWKRREDVVDEIKRQKVESELAYLKQQINPHFLFNVLNSIYSLVLPHSEQASDVVVKLSSILRYMLYETDRDKVSLEKELSIMSDFMELHKLRCTDISDIKYHFDGNFTGLRIEPLIYIPFIENAFKYGTNNVDKPYIDVTVKYENNLLAFSIKNKILNEKKRDEHSGIGINNISRRLDIIYGDSYTMDIKNENGCFEVTIIIPVK